MKLSPEKIEALRKAVFAALAQPAVASEIGTELLHAVDADLVRAGQGVICRHCGERYSKRTNRLCDRCNAYAHRNDGRLPSEETLVKSALRQLDRPRNPAPRSRPRAGRP